VQPYRLHPLILFLIAVLWFALPASGNNWLLEAGWVAITEYGVFAGARMLNFLSDADFACGAALAADCGEPVPEDHHHGSAERADNYALAELLPFPQFVGVNGGYSFINNSIYHALAVKVEKRFPSGFSVLPVYTASKLMDDGANTGQSRPGAAVVTGPQNWNNLRSARSKSVQDVPQRMVVSALWALPFGKNGPALTGMSARGAIATRTGLTTSAQSLRSASIGDNRMPRRAGS